MAEYLAENTANVWLSARDLNGKTVSQNWKVLVTLSVIIVVVFTLMVATHRMDLAESKKLKNDATSRNLAAAHLFPIAIRKLAPKPKRVIITHQKKKRVKVDVADKYKSPQLKALDECLPSIFQTNTFSQRFVAEIKRYHRWIGAVLYYSAHVPRALRILSLVTGVLSLLFVQAITYSLRNPDDGSCEKLINDKSCLQPRSPFFTGDSKCYWSSSSNSCHFRSPGDSLMTVLFVAVFSTLLSAPIVISSQLIILSSLTPGMIINHADSIKARGSHSSSIEGGSFASSALSFLNRNFSSKVTQEPTTVDESSGTMLSFEKEFVLLMEGIRNHRKILPISERQTFDGIIKILHKIY
jgi:hypothetical protein